MTKRRMIQKINGSQILWLERWKDGNCYLVIRDDQGKFVHAEISEFTLGDGEA